MVPSNTKTLKLITPQTVAAASTTTAAVDTLGYDYMTLDFIDGSIHTGTDRLTFLQLSESPTTMSAYTDGTNIAACVGAAATSSTAGFVLPRQSTCTVVPTGVVYRMNVDLKGRKRYMCLLYTPVNASSICAVAHLSRKNEGGEAMVAGDVAAQSTEACECRLVVNA